MCVVCVCPVRVGYVYGVRVECVCPVRVGSVCSACVYGEGWECVQCVCVW